MAEAGALELATDLWPQVVGVAEGIQAQHPDVAVVGPAKALHALDGGRLPCAVGADHADHLPRLDVEVEPVDDHAPAVGLREPSYDDRRWPRAGVCLLAGSVSHRQSSSTTSGGDEMTTG